MAGPLRTPSCWVNVVTTPPREEYKKSQMGFESSYTQSTIRIQFCLTEFHFTSPMAESEILMSSRLCCCLFSVTLQIQMGGGRFFLSTKWNILSLWVGTKLSVCFASFRKKCEPLPPKAHVILPRTQAVRNKKTINKILCCNKSDSLHPSLSC